MSKKENELINNCANLIEDLKTINKELMTFNLDLNEKVTSDEKKEKDNHDGYEYQVAIEEETKKPFLKRTEKKEGEEVEKSDKKGDWENFFNGIKKDLNGNFFFTSMTDPLTDSSICGYYFDRIEIDPLTGKLSLTLIKKEINWNEKKRKNPENYFEMKTTSKKFIVEGSKFQIDPNSTYEIDTKNPYKICLKKMEKDDEGKENKEQIVVALEAFEENKRIQLNGGEYDVQFGEKTIKFSNTSDPRFNQVIHMKPERKIIAKGADFKIDKNESYEVDLYEGERAIRFKKIEKRKKISVFEDSYEEPKSFLLEGIEGELANFLIKFLNELNGSYHHGMEVNAATKKIAILLKSDPEDDKELTLRKKNMHTSETFRNFMVYDTKDFAPLTLVAKKSTENLEEELTNQIAINKQLANIIENFI
jgi:hypothetical protein